MRQHMAGCLWADLRKSPVPFTESDFAIPLQEFTGPGWARLLSWDERIPPVTVWLCTIVHNSFTKTSK